MKFSITDGRYNESRREVDVEDVNNHVSVSNFNTYFKTTFITSCVELTRYHKRYKMSLKSVVLTSSVLYNVNKRLRLSSP